MMSGERNVSLENEKNETNSCCLLANILLFFQFWDNQTFHIKEVAFKNIDIMRVN